MRAMPHAAFVGFVRDSALPGLCPLLARFQSCVVMVSGHMEMLEVMVAACKVWRVALQYGMMKDDEVFIGQSHSWFNSVCGLMAIVEGFLYCADDPVGLMALPLGCCSCCGECLGLKAPLMGCCCWYGEFLGLRALMMGYGVDTLLAPAAFASAYEVAVLMRQAAAAKAAANSIRNVPETQFTSAAVAQESFYKVLGLQAAAARAAAKYIWNESESQSAAVAQANVYKVFDLQAAAARAAAFWTECSLVLLLVHVFETAWLVLVLLSGIVPARFWVLLLVLIPGKVSCTFHGEWKAQKGPGFKIKVADVPFLQALTPAVPGELNDFGNRNGHNTDGSLSLGKWEASGQVDVPVGVPQQAISLIKINFTPLRRSPQSALVTPGSRVEKTVCVASLEERTKMHRVTEYTEVWEIVEGEMDMWVTVNGKRVGMYEVDSGICDHDTIRCYGRLRGGAQRYIQTTAARHSRQWTCSACGQERVWPTKD